MQDSKKWMKEKRLIDKSSAKKKEFKIKKVLGLMSLEMME